MASSHWILNINWLLGKHEFATTLLRTLQRIFLDALQFPFLDFVWIGNLESFDQSFEMLIAKWAHEWVRLFPFLYSGLLLWQIITERYAHLNQWRMALIVPPNTHSFVLVICVNEQNKRQSSLDKANCNFYSTWKPCLVSGQMMKQNDVVYVLISNVAMASPSVTKPFVLNAIAKQPNWKQRLISSQRLSSHSLKSFKIFA